MDTLADIEKLDSLIDGMREKIAGYGEASKILRRIKKNVAVLFVENKRPFDDLIKEIEYDGEKFIPAQKIAELCFNYSGKTVKYKSEMWINNSYDYMMWYSFETKILKPKKHRCSIGISRNFDIWAYHRIEGVEPKTNTGMPPCNQAEIIINLIKWGFIQFK